MTFTDELALKQAERADQQLRAKHDLGPLHGIPFGLKDIVSYPRYPTTWGVGKYRDRVIDVKAAVAERLENAGAVLVAKLATNTLAVGIGLVGNACASPAIPGTLARTQRVRHRDPRLRPPPDSSASR